MSDIHELMNEIAVFTEERDWDQFHSPENLAKSISIEAPRFVFSNKYIPQGLRGSDKGIYLEALEHCIHLDNPFGDVNCGEGCPLWKNCMGTEPDVILLPLKEIIENLDMPADRQAKILAGITRCCDEMQDGCQNECPYGKECEGEDVTFLFRDIHDVLKAAGAY